MSEKDTVTKDQSTSQSTGAVEPVSFCVGEKFSSFSDFENKLTKYEKYNAIQMSRRDSRTLEAAAKRVPKRVEGAPSKLKYYEVHYTCLFGGKTYTRKGNGIRKHQRLVFGSYIQWHCVTVFYSTIKQGCNAGIKLLLSEDKRHLEVTYVSDSHNHIMNKVYIYTCMFVAVIINIHAVC